MTGQYISATQYRISQLFDNEHKLRRNVKDVVNMACSANQDRFALEYAPTSDDINDSFVALHSCRMAHSDYKVLVFRGTFKESGQCSEDPPIYIWVYRNGKPIFAGTPLGENCYGGPSLVSLELHEAQKRGGSAKFCFHPSFDDEPICKVITEMEKALPISLMRYADELLLEKAAR